MYSNKNSIKKAVRFGLLFYSIFMGISGTIMFATLLLWVVPRDQISDIFMAVVIMAIPLYGTCILALFIRAKFFKKEQSSDG